MAPTHMIFFALLFISASSAAQLWSCHLPMVTVEQTEKGEGGLSAAEVEIHIRSAMAFVDPRSIRWSCIDGRSTEPELSTPGGDSGEFIVGLAVYEKGMQLSNPSAALTRDSIRDLLDEYLGNVNRVRQWYLHSDLPTLAKLRAALNDSTFDPSGPVAANQQEAALELLMQPDYVGCPHIRLMMLNPDQYQVRTEIVQGYLAAFYDFMWNHEVGAKFNHITDLEELDGNHNERALVRLFPNYDRVQDTDSDCNGKAPLIAPNDGQNSMFVYHEGFVNVGLRNDIAIFFAEKLGPRYWSAKNLIAEMNELVEMQLALTTSAVGASRTVYTAELLIDEVDAWEPPIPGGASGMTAFSLLLLLFVGVLLGAAIFIGIKQRQQGTEYWGV